MLQSLMESVELTAKEKSILNRGRNAGGSSSNRKRGPKRLYSKGNDGSNSASIYQDSTALEALIGYTYISNTSRCIELLEFIQKELDKI